MEGGHCLDLLGEALCTVLPFVPQLVGLDFRKGKPQENWYNSWWGGLSS